MTIQHMSEVKAENARPREELAAWKQTAEAHKENFDILAGDLRMKLAAAQAAVKKYSDLLRICRLSNLSQELDAAIDAAMKEVGHE